MVMLNIYQDKKSYEGFGKCSIKLNGHVRFKNKAISYFRICQLQQAGHKIPSKHIYMYSFALNPENINQVELVTSLD